MRKQERKLWEAIDGWDEFVQEYYWLPFNDARKLVRSLGFSGQSDFKRYVKTHKHIRIPTSPDKTYASSGWQTWGDWLGTGTVATQQRIYQNFVDARDFVHTLHLKNNREWRNYCKSGNKPDDIPSHADITYKAEWQSWGDWLGTGRIRVEPWSFNKARKFVRKLKLKGQAEWKEYYKSEKKPIEIPTNPHRTYSDWVNYGDWLGNGAISNQAKKKIFLPFATARSIVHSWKLNGKADWDKYVKSGKIPNNIPKAPPHSYGSKWKDWGDWLRGESSQKCWLPFNEARKFVRKLKLDGQAEWHEWAKSTQRPKNIPYHPERAYSEHWHDLADWLGKVA